MKANATTVLNLIGGIDKAFIIPPFQRNYEWGIEQCEELFNDIVTSLKTKKTHYLGNVVYYLGENNGASFQEIILVDGQQRVTTILLLLCAIRDITDEENLKNSINNKYLKNQDEDENYRIRLKQTSYDEESFISLIDQDIKNANKDSNIIKNYTHFYNLIKKGDFSPRELFEAIPKLEVIDINLEIGNDLNTIQTVFEKINSTGKKLSSADLIRNYLLLAKNTKEQEKLYKLYWTKIERTVTNEYISKFARDYLVMNIFDDVSEEKTYKTFKNHFDNMDNISCSDILQEMCTFAEYFAWLKFENSPNHKINHIISYLNCLKTDDLYPLYLYLFRNLFNSNIEELRKILILLSDFMLRYRIVTPSTGGGTLRTVIYQLLEKLNSSEIELSYDAILYELSNSNTPAGRFPDDEEFRNSLMDSFNYQYARPLLLRIEEYETKNISVPIKDVTVEHLLPQTPSQWWIDYYGGKENCERIYAKYLNCIGNLAPMSAGYNSKNSNKPWNEKLEQIKDVQFVVTSEIKQYKEWKEQDIENRNKNISQRACEAITSPLPRKKPYQTKNSSDEFSSGIYPVSDINTPMSGTNVKEIIVDNKTVMKTVTSWKDFLKTICEIVYEIDNSQMRKIARDNCIHKSCATKNYPDKDPIITTNSSLLNDPKEILTSGIFVEGNISSARARVYAKQILDIYGITDDFQIYVEK